MVEFRDPESGQVSSLETMRTSYDEYKPICTIVLCLICIGLFIGINLEGDFDSWEVYRKWGAPSAKDIFRGHYWGLLTSNFLHTEIWHIAFNLYWFWFFGKKIEFETNRIQYLSLIFSAAFISSLAQLGFSGSTGIGFSGIGYALFGFLFIKSSTSEDYYEFLDKRTINLFFGWLVLCVILTRIEVWNVGNAAHIGGLVWGIVIAYSSRLSKAMQWLVRSALFCLIGTAFMWNPFTTSWLSHRAYNLHNDQKIDEAIVVYKKILKRDSESEFAKGNLAQLEKAKLQQKAYKYHSESEYDKAREIYNELLKLDANDNWAKENLSKLPAE